MPRVVLPLALFLLSTNVRFAAGALTIPPPMPAAWPADDQTVMISGALLNDPLITEALAHVESIVPASILSIPPSTYKSGSTVKYNSDPIANCYWPNNLCTRNTKTANFDADIVTCPGTNTWGLTYDDGPSSNIVNGVHVADTAALREQLDSMNLKATFFVCGTNVRALPDEVKASYASGHQIAVHTWTHHPLTSLTNAQIVAELKYTEAAIYQAIGKVPTHYRPPYGDIDDRVRAIASALGYRTVVWTTTPDRDTGDADGVTTDAYKSQILSTVSTWNVAQPGFITLEHDINKFVAGVAIDILGWIKQQGAGLKLNIQDIATCTGTAAYVGDVASNGTQTSTSTSTSASTSSSTSTTSVQSSTTSTSTSSTLAVTTDGQAKTPVTTLPSGTSSSTPTPTSQTTLKSDASALGEYIPQVVAGALVAMGLNFF